MYRFRLVSFRITRWGCHHSSSINKKMAGVLPEAEAAAQRLKIRNALKQEFLKKVTHPFRHLESGYVVCAVALSQLS